MPTVSEMAPGQLGDQRIRKVVYSEAEIAERVSAMAADISATYTADDQLLSQVTGLIRPPSFKKPDIFTAADLKTIERHTSQTAHRLGLGRYV